MLALATKHGQSPAAVLLKWARQQGVAVIPKSSAPARMAENFAALTGSQDKAWALDASDLASLDALDQSGNAGMDARLCWKTDPLKHLEFE